MRITNWLELVILLTIGAACCITLMGLILIVRDIINNMDKGEGEVAYTIKDSDERKSFAGGMVRDTAEGKIDYTLLMDGPMLERWAAHLARGARKYAKRNWTLAQDQEALDRFRESAFRHFLSWLRGETDEDHGAAVFFNINGAEYVLERLKGAEEFDRNRELPAAHEATREGLLEQIAAADRTAPPRQIPDILGQGD